MRYTFLISASDGSIVLPSINSGRQVSYGKNQLSLEFYNNATLSSIPGIYINPTNPSTGVTGQLLVQAKPSLNAELEDVPDGNIDLTNSEILGWEGVVGYVSLTKTGITNTNFINIIIDLY